MRFYLIALLMLFRAMIYSNCTVNTVQNTFLFRIIWNALSIQQQKTILASYFVVSTNLRSNFKIELFFIFAQRILFTPTTWCECRWLHLNSGELAVNSHLVACFGKNKDVGGRLFIVLFIVLLLWFRQHIQFS